MNLSIASALEGEYGDHHRTERTHGSEFFINPPMSVHFAFELQSVAERLLYRHLIQDTQTAFDVMARIEAFRRDVELRGRRDIPV